MTFFDRAFVINLDVRRDRYEDFARRLSEIDTPWLPDVERVKAVHGDTCQPPNNWTGGAGAWGCYKSHMSIIEQCLDSRCGSFLVFEDDAQFRPTFADADKFLEKLPDDWQQVYLGGQLMHCKSHPPYEVTAGVYRPYNVNRTHCYGISRLGMLAIYRHCSDLPFENKFHIDHHLGRWHEDERNKVYCPARWYVGQHGYSSNVSGKTETVQYYDDPISLANDHWLYSSPVCVVYQGSRSIADVLLPVLHFGNQLASNGFDVSLERASKLKDPSREIAAWYGWIRSEVVKGQDGRIPALMHPMLTVSEIQAALPDCRLIIIETVSNLSDLKEQLNKQGLAL